MPDIVSPSRDVARGRKYTQTLKDVLFMTLPVLMHRGQLGFMRNVFRIKGPTFDKLIVGYIRVDSRPLYEAYVKTVLSNCHISSNRRFHHFKSACYATDVKLQQFNLLFGFMLGAKPY